MIAHRRRAHLLFLIAKDQKVVFAVIRIVRAEDKTSFRPSDNGFTTRPLKNVLFRSSTKMLLKKGKSSFFSPLYFKQFRDNFVGTQAVLLIINL